MNNKENLNRFQLKGVDCPVCASNIESALRASPGLENSRLDFAGGLLYIDPRYVEHAQTIIRQMEPEAVLHTGKPAEEQPLTLWQKIVEKELLRIVLAAAVFAAGLFHLPAVWKHVCFIAAYILAGTPVVIAALKNIFRGKLMDELFLMTVASAGAMAIGELPEAAAVMLFYALGEYLQNRAVARSRIAIQETMNLRNIHARVQDGETWKEVDPETVKEGTVVEILPGDTVPLDGEVCEGSSWMDTSALTGESVLRQVQKGSEVSAGYVNDEGRILIRTTRPYSLSAMARVQSLLEQAAGRKAPTERILARFAAVYTPAVVILALLLAFLPPLLGAWPLRQSVYKAMILLVISCPCALVVSVPMAYFAGIGRASRDKILLKGADVLDTAAKVDTVVFDKTGTLTEGNFRVQKIHSAGKWSEADLINLAGNILGSSRHPIARSVSEYISTHSLTASKERQILRKDLESVKEIKGMGMQALWKNNRILAGNARFLSEAGVEVPGGGIQGSVVHLALGTEYLGTIELADALKKTAPAALRDIKQMGIGKTALLTGDSPQRAGKAAEELGIDLVKASLLPEGKMEELEKLMAAAPPKKKTAFVGDGLNDAPVILRADLGMAMGHGGSDMAIEAADAVFMDDNPLRIPLLFRIGRFTRRIVLQNIWFALGIKAVLMLSGVFAGLPMWAAVLGDTGVALLAVANSLRILGSRRKMPEL